jgi:hypothetical protein
MNLQFSGSIRKNFGNGNGSFWKIKNLSFLSCLGRDLNGSVGSIADLKSKGPGFESRISQGFFLM